MPMDNVTLENTQQSISSRDAKSVASVMVNGKWVNLSDTLEQANVKSDVGTVSKQVAEQQTVITSAVAQADSAVAYANDAIEKSRVNSQAIVEINSAVSDAVSDAAVARSDGLRAWNAAQSNADLIDQNYASASAAISSARTEAIAAADEAKKSASAAQADIVAVRSDVAAVQADVTATKSDVAVAKSDIAVVKTNLASQATSLSSYASQASAMGKDITVLKSQAGQFEQEMADTKGDVSQLKVSASSASAALSDAAGNISSLQASAKSYSAALSDTNSNVASVTATASKLETKYADAAGDINQIKADAKGMTQTISNAQGDIAKLKTRADGFDTKYANVAGDINTLKVDASGMTQTLSDAQGDIAKLKIRADGFDTQFSSTNGNINKLQTDASGTKQTLTNAKSDIAVLQSRADGFDTKYADAAGDISTLKVDASGMKQTLTNAKGDISTLQNTTKGLQTTMTNAQGDISTLKVNVSGLQKTTSDHAGNIATLQSDAKTLTSQMSNAQGDISTLKQTATSFGTRISGVETSSENANDKINNLSTSGRNYIKNSELFTMTGNGTDNYDLPWVVYTNAFFTNPHCNDANKTRLSFDLTPTKALSTAKTYPIYWRKEPWTYFGTITVPANTTAKQHYQLVITTPTTQGWADQIFMRFMKDSTSDVSFKIEHSMLTIGDAFADWQPAPEDTADKISVLSTSIDQTKDAIKLKADQTVVDKTNGDVAQLKSQLKVQADQISGKVSSSDLDAKGYATQTYTQTLVKQTADTWNLNLTNVKNDEAKDVTNLNASIDGIKADVYNKDGSSKITQLSNLIATKVSQGDYNSQINQLKNDINLRVAKGDVISQINQEAGGNTLIRVSNGKGALILDAGNTIVTGKAWIPSAAIANLTADDIKTGTLTGSTVHLDDGNGNTIDLGALSTDYVGFHSKATNGDQTYIDLNGIHNYGSSYDTKISQGKITTNLLAVNGGGLIDFRSSGNGTTIDSQNIKFYNSNAVNGGIEFSGGSPLATARDGAVGNELRVRYDRSFALTPITDEAARICASSVAMQVGFVQSGSSTPDRQTTGLWVDNDRRHVNLGVWGADSTWARVEANTHNIHMQADKAHAWLSSDNVFHIYKDGDSSSTAAKLQVDGWAWINGWVEAAGHSQHSALSTKTEIQPVDDDKMLEMVNDTDLATFLYKTDVANGETHRHIGLIIDDVHDVAQYQTPQDFIAPNGVSRDDDNMIGALFGAVKALTKRIKTLESKVG